MRTPLGKVGAIYSRLALICSITASAEAVLKRYNSCTRTHPTYKALTELGKAAKTMFLCQYRSSREIQREVHEGLNVVEN